MRAEFMCATSNESGIPNSSINTGGIAPPQGLIRDPRSSNNTLWPSRANSFAAVLPEGPPPTITASNSSYVLIIIYLPCASLTMSLSPKATNFESSFSIEAGV